MMHSRK
jgi:centrin-3